MNTGERWRIRWTPRARSWLDHYRNRLSPSRRNRLRFALDRKIQQIAQFPESLPACNTRYEELRDLSDSYRVAVIENVILVYLIADTQQMIVFVHTQSMAMDMPGAAVFL